jgi:hypothetical protein
LAVDFLTYFDEATYTSILVEISAVSKLLIPVGDSLNSRSRRKMNSVQCPEAHRKKAIQLIK